MDTLELPQVPSKRYRITNKFNRWFELMTDKSKPTFGNATQSALIAYDLDANDPSQYHTATNLGYRNKRKVGDLGSLYLDKKGVSFGMLLDIALVRMFKSNSISWWLLIMDIMGYDTPPRFKKGVNLKMKL